MGNHLTIYGVGGKNQATVKVFIGAFRGIRQKVALPGWMNGNNLIKSWRTS
jgi:hypothetical protein